jgi:uncharacterized protein
MQMIARIGIAAVVWLVASCQDSASIAPPTEQMTADCAAPTYATDMLVCEDPDLSALDEEVARLWTERAAGSGGDAAAVEAQASWFRERSLCAFEADHRGCALAAYQARLAELRAGTPQ